MSIGLEIVGRQWNNDTIRQLERDSIQAFIVSQSAFLSGRVLDYGAGTQPYRWIVESVGGRYTPFDRIDFPGNVSGKNLPDTPRSTNPLWHSSKVWDAILCTQILQYLDFIEFADRDGCGECEWEPLALLENFRGSLARAPLGVLVLTYPTCWDEVETDDLWRFTKAGMERLLEMAGFSEILIHERRAQVGLGGFAFPLGYGVVARA